MELRRTPSLTRFSVLLAALLIVVAARVGESEHSFEDGHYLWAETSLRKAKLRGNIVLRDMWD